MSIISINTTQNVHIDFVTASAGERILAYIIDMIIKIAYLFIAFQILKAIGLFNSGFDDMLLNAFLILMALPFIFYSLIFETWMNGQTIGKRLLKIKVIKIDGFQASFPDHMMRWLFRVVDLLILNGIIALLFVIINNRGQRLGDIVAGTTVISLKDRNQLHQTVLMEIEDTYQPTYPAAAFLSDKDARIIKRNFEHAMMKGDTMLLIKLRDKVMSVLDIKYAGKDAATFITDVLRDFNHYTKKDL